MRRPSWQLRLAIEIVLRFAAHETEQKGVYWFDLVGG